MTCLLGSGLASVPGGGPGTKERQHAAKSSVTQVAETRTNDASLCAEVLKPETSVPPRAVRTHDQAG